MHCSYWELLCRLELLYFIPAVEMKADGAACPPAVRLDLTTEPLGQPEQTSQRLSAQLNKALEDRDRRSDPDKKERERNTEGNAREEVITWALGPLPAVRRTSGRPRDALLRLPVASRNSIGTRRPAFGSSERQTKSIFSQRGRDESIHNHCS